MPRIDISESSARMIGEDFGELLELIDSLLPDPAAESRHRGGGKKPLHFSSEFPGLSELILDIATPFQPPALKKIRF